MNCQLPIANCQLFAPRGGLSRRGENRSQLASLLLLICEGNLVPAKRVARLQFFRIHT